MRLPMGMTMMVLGAALVSAPRVGAAAQANQNKPAYPSQQGPGALPPLDGRTADPNDPMTAIREAARMRAQMNDRQRHIVEETAKLLALANELKQAVDKTGKDEMSLEVIRKADEIERLAHDVKQRMKG